MIEEGQISKLLGDKVTRLIIAHPSHDVFAGRLRQVINGEGVVSDFMARNSPFALRLLIGRCGEV